MQKPTIRTRVYRKFVHYFVPNKRNKYRPLFLRIEMVAATAALILVLFVGATLADRLLVTSGSPQVAAVVVATLVDLANTDRAQNGLATLTVSPLLEQAAQLKANDMAAKGYFAHVSPDGEDPWYWFAQAGYDFTFAGENLAVYFSDSDAVNTAWMNSPEHRANILSDHFTEIGIATAQGMYQGKETTFVVQEFGTPTSAPRPAVATEHTAAVAVAGALAASAPVSPGVPTVRGDSVKETPVKVLQQSPTFIAVEREGSPAPDLTATAVPASSPVNPISLLIAPISTIVLKFVTSPQTDLRFVYGIIGAIVAMALILEVAIEVRRQHPHRIAMGLSLISLMIILVYAGHLFFAGNLIIA